MFVTTLISCIKLNFVSFNKIYNILLIVLDFSI